MTKVKKKCKIIYVTVVILFILILNNFYIYFMLKAYVMYNDICDVSINYFLNFTNNAIYVIFKVY